jgi:hypothetical protein
MVQAPTPVSVTAFPATEQTARVVELKVTLSPEEAVAVTAIDTALNGLLARAANVMV